ncbi:MAG: MFS transporter [Acidimicrobiales bacterium]|jgi:MFS family permease
MPANRLPGSLRVLLGASFVSSVGGGLTLPFLVIYLHQVRHIPLGVSGLLIGAVAVLALPVSPVAGALVDRLGAREVVIVTMVVQGLGIAALATVHSVESAIPAMFVYGLGQAAGWPTWNALLGVMVGDDKLSRLAFARNFQLLNLGLGVGAIVGGLVVHVRDPGTFVTVYLVNGACALVVVPVLALLPKKTFRSTRRVGPPPAAGDGSSAAEVQGGRRPGYRAVLGDAVFRRYLVTMTILMAAGYGALNTGFVGFATSVAKAGPGTIAAAYAANTGFIVLAQPLALRIVARTRRTSALKVVAAAFAACWVVLACAGLAPGSGASRALVIATLVVFASGEVFLSPVSGPLVNDLATPALRGRYFAASAMCVTVANVVSPAISGAAIGAGFGVLLLGFFVACCAASAVGAQWLRRALTPSEDNAQEQSPGAGEPVGNRAEQT